MEQNQVKVNKEKNHLKQSALKRSLLIKLSKKYEMSVALGT